MCMDNSFEHNFLIWRSISPRGRTSSKGDSVVHGLSGANLGQLRTRVERRDGVEMEERSRVMRDRSNEGGKRPRRGRNP